jgi:orotate phosphoribosyltransferase-like protein
MPQLNERLQTDVHDFRDRVLTDPVGVLDPEGVVHHEFVSGNHGRKLDFDKIPTDSDFYIDWVSIYARVIRARFEERLPDALVGVANGANRLSESVSPLLGKSVLGLTTVKLDAKTVQLDEDALEAIHSKDVKFALIIEDVGATGSTTATAIERLREAGVRRIESITTWQRNPTLPRIDALRVPYSSMIPEALPMFTPEGCASDPLGFCAQGIPLVPHA